MKTCTNILVATRAPCAKQSFEMMPLACNTEHQAYLRFVRHWPDSIELQLITFIIIAAIYSFPNVCGSKANEKILTMKASAAHLRTEHNKNSLWSVVRKEVRSPIARRNQLWTIVHVKLFRVRRRMCERNCAQRTQANESRYHSERRRLHSTGKKIH